MILNILLFLVVLGFCVHIIMKHHNEPTSAILWLALMIFLREWTIPFYLVFGMNYSRHRHKKILNSNNAMKARAKESKLLSQQWRILEQFHSPMNDLDIYHNVLNKISPEFPALEGNDIELYNDGTQVYPAMLEAIKNAKHHIHLSSYIFERGKASDKILAALEAKSKECVMIKIIFDKFGTHQVSNLLKHFIRKSNQYFLVCPFELLNIYSPYRIQLRNHRKLLIIDGEIAFIGGINISDDNDKRISKNVIHDLHCKIRGTIISHLQYVFLRDWSYAAKTPSQKLLNTPEFFPQPKSIGNNLVRISASGQGQNFQATYRNFLTAAQCATKSIWIMTPYFVPDQTIIQSLCMAAAKGVEIKIIVPKNNNHQWVKYASESFYTSLMANHIEIFERGGNFSHSKAMLVDNQWVMMGSSNCDNRSFRLNYELDFICEKGDFVEVMHKQFLKELNKSTLINYERHLKRSFLQKFKENIYSLFSPIM